MNNEVQLVWAYPKLPPFFNSSI